jgi:hypothetical protein
MLRSDSAVFGMSVFIGAVDVLREGSVCVCVCVWVGDNVWKGGQLSSGG